MTTIEERVDSLEDSFATLTETIRGSLKILDDNNVKIVKSFEAVDRNLRGSLKILDDNNVKIVKSFEAVDRNLSTLAEAIHENNKKALEAFEAQVDVNQALTDEVSRLWEAIADLKATTVRRPG